MSNKHGFDFLTIFLAGNLKKSEFVVFMWCSVRCACACVVAF